MRTVFDNFEKTQTISLYWFAAQRQTSTSRDQKLEFFYLRISSQFNELKSKFKSDKKWPKNY